MSILSRHFLFVVLTILSLAVAGCCAPNGLVKTPLNDRKCVSYPSLGITIDLPKQSKDIYACYTLQLYDFTKSEAVPDVKFDLVACMHPVWFGSMLVEPDYLLVFHVSRVSSKEYNKFLIGDQYLNGIYGDKPEPFKEAVVQYEMKEKHGERQFLVFRKDIKLPDGDIVVAGERLRKNVYIPNKEDDLKAIVEILNFVKPLDGKTE